MVWMMKYPMKELLRPSGEGLFHWLGNETMFSNNKIRI